MNKSQLVSHIENLHPEHVYPKKRDGLGKWTKDELEASHAELHNGGCSNGHTHEGPAQLTRLGGDR